MKKLLPILIFIIVGCEKTPFETYPGALNIFALIRPDRSRQWVKVDKTYRMDKPSTVGVNDVLVVIRGEGFVDTLFLSDSTSSTYVSSDSIPILPMHKYYLSVKEEDLDSVYGTTTVPETIVVLHPKDGDTVNLSDSLVFKNKNNNWYSVIANMIGDTTVSISNEIGGMGYFESDTIVVIKFSNIIRDEGSYIIKIMAYDDNYTQYISGMGGATDFTGINGGFGVFGSAIVKGLSLYIKPK